jgi:predicted amidohydrolase YtcJ
MLQDFNLPTALRCVFFAAMSLAATPVFAQADKILVNGKIVTVDKEFSTKDAIAIAGDKILATGTNDAMRKLASPGATIVDLGGRTVIPGLTDAHLHGVRAALTYAIEVNWIGVTSIEEALSRLKAAAQQAGPGAWLIVAGGWMDAQFKEKRKPTQAEIMAAAPGRPVYLQQLYEWVLLSPEGMRELNISSDEDVPAKGKLVLDQSGKPNGEIVGSAITMMGLFNKLPRPTAAQEKEGSRAFFRELNRLGLTGFIDPAGVSVFPVSYRPAMELWRDGQLTVRLAYHISSQQPGKELDDYKSQTRLLISGFGDDMLKFNGLGEIVT